MSHLIFGKDEILAEWVARQIPVIGAGRNFGSCKAVGVAEGPNPKDLLLAAVVFHDYHPEFSTCQISMASASPRWATRGNIREILAFPFLQYGVNKVWTATPHTSKRVIAFNKAIGFIKEAELKDHFGPGIHAAICRMGRRYYMNTYLKDTKQKAA